MAELLEPYYLNYADGLKVRHVIQSSDAICWLRNHCRVQWFSTPPLQTANWALPLTARLLPDHTVPWPSPPAPMHLPAAQEPEPSEQLEPVAA